MKEIQYHRKAQKAMAKIPTNRRAQIKSAIEDVAQLDDPLDHSNVELMRGKWDGCYRIRVGTYRAIFIYPNGIEGEVLQVLQVGPRGDIY